MSGSLPIFRSLIYKPANVMTAQSESATMTKPHPGKISAWVEAMRLRTLPVSVAGVIAALGYGIMYNTVNIAVSILCLIFAVLAQIASNFANEYFDYRDGLDRVGREGPRRGVTEGDITPEAMRTATFITLAVACAIGLLLTIWGGWIIIPFGIIIALGVLAYSTGPFALAHHGLGEVAVVIFFGIAPVTLTFYLMSGYVDTSIFNGSLALGLMGANVLLVNNIRDINDDRAVRKHTLVVILGRRFGSFLYLVNGWIAVWLMGGAWMLIDGYRLIIPGAYLVAHTLLWYTVDRRSGRAMNPLLGMTACLMLAYALLFTIAATTA